MMDVYRALTSSMALLRSLSHVFPTNQLELSGMQDLPACKTYIRHERETPRPRQTYRCHVCRLELVVDATEGKLTVTPLPFELSKP
jgi:hypothetical protein